MTHLFVKLTDINEDLVERFHEVKEKNDKLYAVCNGMESVHFDVLKCLLNSKNTIELLTYNVSTITAHTLAFLIGKHVTSLKDVNIIYYSPVPEEFPTEFADQLSVLSEKKVTIIDSPKMLVKIMKKDATSSTRTKRTSKKSDAGSKVVEIKESNIENAGIGVEQIEVVEPVQSETKQKNIILSIKLGEIDDSLMNHYDTIHESLLNSCEHITYKAQLQMNGIKYENDINIGEKLYAMTEHEYESLKDLADNPPQIGSKK